MSRCSIIILTRDEVAIERDDPAHVSLVSMLELLLVFYCLAAFIRVTALYFALQILLHVLWGGLAVEIVKKMLLLHLSCSAICLHKRSSIIICYQI